MRKLRLAFFTMLVLSFATPLLAQVAPVTENPTGISSRLQHEIDMTKDPALGYVPQTRLVEAYKVRKNKIELSQNALATNRISTTWIERGPYTDVVGPSNGNTRPGNGKTSGRMRAIWEDLNDATGKTVWVGGIDGGLWKTNDITANPATWTPINDFFGNLAVSSICQDPSSPNIMYFGTGEKALNADAVRGAGLWVSTDGGVNWNVMPGTANFWNVGKITCDASGNLYVGCNSISNTSGLQRYTKSTATWTNITPSGLDPRVPDIELSSTGRLHIVCGYYNTPAASSGYRYTDNPETVTAGSWTSPATTFPTQYNVMMESNGNTLYALSSNSAFQVTTIYKSTNGGANWAATGTTPGFTSGQAWYCMGVAVDPNNADNVIVGSLDCYKTTNGGTTWSKISEWVGTTGQYVHADQQIITWRSNNQVLVGSDGGIHYSANGGATFSDRNEGLRIKQFYSVAIHPTSTNYFLAGAQDNGTHQLNGAGLASSVEVTGGDGAFVEIDQNEPQYQFGAYVYNQYRRSTNGGSSWTSVNYSSSAGQFINPFDYDNTNNILYASGVANAFVRWSNPQTGSTFTSVTASGLGGGKVTALKVSPYTNHTVYFGGGGSGVAPTLLKATATNATPTFTSILGTGMNTTSARISCIELGTDEQNIIVVYSNYGVNNIWVTNNGGTTWAAVDGNLPDMPVRWAMFMPGDNSKAIIATETGVWYTTNLNSASTVWEPETTFPNVRVDMLQYRASDNLLAASTHGRGLFTTILNTATATCGSVTGLASSGITQTGATVSWSALSGANNYDVDYKLNSSSTWISAVTATTNTSVAISGLTAASLYDYRVRANCTGATGAYTQAQLTTTATPTCNAPTGLASSGITSSGATISFTAVSGAANYDVDFKLNSSATWVNVSTGTTSTSVALTGLSASSLYDYRVRANCTAVSLSSIYSTAQFTTAAAPSCNAPVGLTSSSITTNSATVSWSAVSGAANYDVDYKLNSSATWINAATASASTSVALSSLNAGSLYDWRVRANCTSVGLTSGYAQLQFTTNTAITCPGPLDVSTNGNATGAATIPFNTDVKGLISPSRDNDYYKFVITTGGTATITLTTLPADYDVRLYSSNGTTQLAISQNGGTNSETITRTYTAGTYYVRVYGYQNANNATNCYTLKVQLGTAAMQELPITQNDVKVKMFPNPVTSKLSVYMVGDNKRKDLQLYDVNGKLVYTQALTDMFTTLDLSALAKGMYFVKVTLPDGKVVYSEKVMKD
jgi:trimeric autotransporter adhesin